MNEDEFNALLENARIKLNKVEGAKIKKDVEDILGYFDELDKISVENTAPAYHPVDVPGVMREDTPEEFVDKKSLLDNTKTHRFYVIGPEL